jgi:DNA-binding transcriptional ArsR family regulator
VRQRKVDQPHHRKQQQLDRGLCLVGVDADRRTGRGTAAVGDHDVDAAMELGRPVHRSLEGRRMGDVAGDRGAAHPVRLPLQDVLAARHHDDVRALRRERLGARQAQNRGGAADERGAAAQARDPSVDPEVATGDDHGRSADPHPPDLVGGPVRPGLQERRSPDLGAFAALASPRRLQILQWLKDPRSHFPPQKDGDLVHDGVCVLFIADKLGVEQPTATSHLQALARAGLVTSKRAGQWTFYKRDEGAIHQIKRQISSTL